MSKFSAFMFSLLQHSTILYLLKWFLVALCIGGCIGSASAGFLVSLEWATRFREEHDEIIFLLPISGFVIGCLYHYYGKTLEGGNNLLIETIQGKKEKISYKMAPFVYLGTIITHIFGGSAGREGTALQMAGSIADQFTSLFRLSEEERKVLLIASVAAGFGSVFGTPLAGVIFALEFSYIGKIRYNALFSSVMAAVVGNLATTFWGANHTHYHIDFVPDVTPQIILWVIFAGILFGVCAQFFSRFMKWLSTQFKKYIHYPPFRPFIGGLIILFLVLGLGTSRYIGLGIPIIVEAFEQPLPFQDFALKIVFTVITLSCGFKGGEVTPLFFIGATLGSALSLFIPLPTALLAGIGFVAVFSGATNTPLACTVMGIELFGSDGAIYMLIACVISYILSGNTSIYNQQKVGESKTNNPLFRGRFLKDL